MEFIFIVGWGINKSSCSSDSKGDDTPSSTSGNATNANERPKGKSQVVVKEGSKTDCGHGERLIQKQFL